MENIKVTFLVCKKTNVSKEFYNIFQCDSEKEVKTMSNSWKVQRIFGKNFGQISQCAAEKVMKINSDYWYFGKN